MWKKTLLLLLTVCLCLFMAACGSSGSGDTGGAASGSTAADSSGDPLAVTGEVGKFKTKDLDGNEVTEAIFAEKDMTVLHIWGTFCGPCIEEMAEVGELAKGLPENAQLIGIVCDVMALNSAEHQAALDILKENNAEFTNLITSSELEKFVREFQFVPTTLIIDSEGNVCGAPIVGAGTDRYQSAAQRYLDSLS